ncbi:uncharacterized protein LOC133832615 [Humulus lupulus]|uniref:uncharacterized protein LOC133832615 n=1 Tax=Humulus lupulus TaxID=3486 RepID=UPI002B409EDA|nr:uncharacterized protein LOC133832615 [Humulus lupulus]
MDSCTIGSWNVRGLNNKDKKDSVLEFCNVNKIGAGGLLETKLKGNKVQELMDKKYVNWDFFTSPTVEGHRKNLLQSLVQLKFLVKPWLILGDFNSANVETLKSYGSIFTWTNNQDGNKRIYSKIDHVFVNEEWHDDFPNTTARFRWEVISDHCSCVVSATATEEIGIKPFRYYNFWADHQDFKTIVEQNWKRPMAARGLKGVYLKLMRVKHCLKKFNHESIGDIGKTYWEAKACYSKAKQQAQSHSRDMSYQEQEAKAAATYDIQEKMYHNFLRQRSKITWLQKGDSNTSYFHACLKKRKVESRITTFTTDQGMINDNFSEVVEHFLNHFRSYMGSRSNVNTKLKLSCIE